MKQGGDDMMRFVFRLSCLMFFSLASFAGAQAQVYGTDYLSFEGTAVILDNPTSAACQADGIYYDYKYRLTYRFTANPSLIADAIAFYPGGDNAVRMISTQSPNFSLSGASTVSWSDINHYANYNSGLTSSSNLTILAGINTPVGLGTGNIKITGSIGDFLNYSGCTINQIHAALVAIPQ
jgi:hypothetical protein